MLKAIAPVLLSCLLISASSFSQQSDEINLAALVENFRKAMVDADTKTLADMTAGQLSYGHSSGLVEDKAAFVDEFVTGQTVFKSIILSDQTIKISGDVAIVRHRLTGDTNNKNVPGKVDIFVLMIWQKQSGQWKLLARQAVKPPVAAK
ncbi:MAG: nuclear transport factor 2 family protein [Ferruginibacter sp.]